MRNLEDIKSELAEAREALSSVEGTPSEVYSRIVGYYRSVRNWNRGKREEYGERRLYCINGEGLSRAAASPSFERQFPGGSSTLEGEERLLLFIRAVCPLCPPAKKAAGKLGIPVTLVDTDTAEGLAEARMWNVLSTPTAILLSKEGRELGRAKDAKAIGELIVQDTAQSKARSLAMAV